MDPVTVFSLVALCGSIASRITCVVRDINDLRERYKGIDMATDMVIVQITALQNACSRLSTWMEGSATQLAEEERSCLKESLVACEHLILSLHQHVEGVKGETERLTFRNKTRFLWNEGTVREYRELLQSQVQALSFHLQVLLLPSQVERQSLRESERGRHILNKARDDTSSLVSLKDSESTHSGQSEDSISSSLSKLSDCFTFDQELVSSKVYRNVLAAYIKHDVSRKNERNGKIRTFISSSSKNSSQGSTFRGEAGKDSTLSCDIFEDAVTSFTRNSEEEGDDETLRGMDGMTQLSCSSEKFQLHRLDCLLSEAIKSDSLEMIKRLLEDPTNPEFPPKWFPWCLRTALDEGSLDAALLLFEHGIEVEAIDAFGRTPLSYSSSRGSTIIASRLLGLGANIEAKNFSGETPLHAACLGGHRSTIQLLVERGADLEARNCRYETPLHYVCLWGDAGDAHLLIAKGAALHARSQGSDTPLTYAIRNGHSAVVSVIVNALRSSTVEAKLISDCSALINGELARQQYKIKLLDPSNAHFSYELEKAAEGLRHLVRCAAMLLSLRYNSGLSSSDVASSCLGLASTLRFPTSEGADSPTVPPVWSASSFEDLCTEHMQEILGVLERTTDEDFYKRLSCPDESIFKRGKRATPRSSAPFRVARRLSERFRPSNNIKINTFVEVSVDTR